MTDEQVELFKRLGKARKRNIEVFAKMAALCDAEALGFKPRDPDAVDVTLRIMEAAVEAAPAEALPLLAQIVDNDRVVTSIADRLARTVREVVR